MDVQEQITAMINSGTLFPLGTCISVHPLARCVYVIVGYRRSRRAHVTIQQDVIVDVYSSDCERDSMMWKNTKSRCTVISKPT